MLDVPPNPSDESDDRKLQAAKGKVTVNVYNRRREQHYGPRRAPRWTRCNRFPPRRSWLKLTAAWPTSRLVDTWNSVAAVAPFDDLKPLKKFSSRKLAITRDKRSS
jgi:hypothetical protein